MNKQAWYRAVYECLDGFEWIEAEVAERVSGSRVIDRAMTSPRFGVAGFIAFTTHELSRNLVVQVAFFAKEETAERVWRVNAMQTPQVPSWNFDSREKAMEQVVVALTGVGASRALKP